jgi:hypothetical protein
MGDEVEGMWKATAVAQFKVISRHLIGVTEDNDKSSLTQIGIRAEN